MELDNCYARGKRLHDEYQAVLANPDNTDKVHFPYRKVYTVDALALAGSWSPLSPQESSLVKSKGVTVTDFITHDVSCEPTSDPKKDTAVYQNAFSEPFILCLNNFKENDTSRPALPLSEILYQGYEEVILEKVAPPSPSPAPKDAATSAPIGEKPDLTKLKYIWQMTVVNPSPN